MYDRYGSPGFLAAYNAGPRRVDDYLLGARNLPGETRNYVATVAPRIGGNTAYAYAPPPSPAPAARGGPIQVADAMEPIRSPGDPGLPPAPTAASPWPVTRMEPIRSPGDPGLPLAPAPASPGLVARMEPIRSPGDPGMPPGATVPMAPTPSPGGYGAVASRPLPASGSTSVLAAARPAPPPAASPVPGPPAPTPDRRAGGFRLISPALADTPPRAPGHYAIQVGAFASPGEARGAADEAKGLASASGAETLVGPVARRDGSVLFRARLTGLSADAAEAACRRVLANGRPCTVVPPDGS